MLELFLRHGADINTKNYKRETALHYAARDNQTILQDLLDNGADLEVETERGKTPLCWAAQGGQRESTEMLVKAGAKIVPALLQLATDRFHSAFHLLLDVGMANEETASLSLLALRECARIGYGLCGQCRLILSGYTAQMTLPIRNRTRVVELQKDGVSDQVDFLS